MSTDIDTNNAVWKVNTSALLAEVLQNHGCAILEKPLAIFGCLLAAVGERAAELNDDQLNGLMCRLAIYEVSDPYNNGFDSDITKETIAKGITAKNG